MRVGLELKVKWHRILKSRWEILVWINRGSNLKHWLQLPLIISLELLFHHSKKEQRIKDRCNSLITLYVVHQNNEVYSIIKHYSLEPDDRFEDPITKYILLICVWCWWYRCFRRRWWGRALRSTVRTVGFAIFLCEETSLPIWQLVLATIAELKQAMHTISARCTATLQLSSKLVLQLPVQLRLLEPKSLWV